jgi:FAD synthase
MEAKELFKKLVKDARERNVETIMAHGSQHPSDFKMPKGRFCHISDAFIDSLSDEGVEEKMVTFIYQCFRQR